MSGLTVSRSLAERTEAMFRSVDPTGQLAVEWATALRSLAPLSATAATRQYYYRMNHCKAKHHAAGDCICWHDEGTGPMPEGLRNSLTWRDKPLAAAPAPAPVEPVAFEVDFKADRALLNKWLDLGPGRPTNRDLVNEAQVDEGTLLHLISFVKSEAYFAAPTSPVVEAGAPEILLRQDQTLDEVISKAGCHLERMDRNHWFLDANGVAVWLYSEKEITATYERRNMKGGES